MPQVPFSGVPTVAPQMDATPRYSADVSPATFGANVGQAIQGLGKTVEGAGNELFARAIAMQDLHNHSEALEADAKYSMQAGTIYENYKEKMGKDAVDAMPQYQKDLADARKSVGDGLSNDMSRKLFDTTSLSTFTRTTLWGAAHSATQNKNYALQSGNAKIQAIGDRVLSNPQDEQAFQDGLAETKAQVTAAIQLDKGAGPDDPITQEAVTQATSKLWAQRIKGLIKTQPITAGKMLESAIKAGQVRGEDIMNLTNQTTQAIRTVGARMVSQQVSTGAGNRYGEGQVDINQASQAIAHLESGGNYDTQVDTGSKHGVALGKYGVMSGFLPEFLQQAGMPPMSSAEFLKNHAAQDQLFAIRFSALMKETGSANGAAARWIGLGKADAFGTDAKAYVAKFNVALAKNAPESARVEMGNRIAAEQAPQDPLFPDAVQQRVRADYSAQTTIKRDDIWQARQPIENTLVGAMTQGGTLPTTVEELTADPATREAWDKLGELDPTRQRYYLNVLARNAKGDHALTNETLKQYTQLTGEAIQRPADFVNENILDTNLPIAKKSELIKLQQAIQGKTDKGNPAVTQAMHDSADSIFAAGITPKDKEDYDMFTGALADQLRQWSQDNQKPPNYEDRQLIVSRLLQKYKTQWGPFSMFTDETPTYKLPVPADVAAQAKKLNPELTDTEIQREYTRQLFKKQYGKTPKATTASAATPVSQ